MQRIYLAVFALLLALSPCAFGQASAVLPADTSSSVVPKEEQATKEDVLALFEVMHSRRTAEAALQMMSENMNKGSRASFLRQYPNASPEILKKLDALSTGAIKVVDIDAMLVATIPIYQRYLSHEDAISIVSFYSTPAGQRYLERMPALLKDVGDVSTKIVLSHLDEIQASVQKAMEEFQKYIAAHPEEVGAPAESQGSTPQ